MAARQDIFRSSDPRLPRHHGEDFLTYMHRLAVFLGYMSEDAPKVTEAVRLPGEDG